MRPLAFPRAYEFDIREVEGRLVVRDELRGRDVRLTPEEWVRQHLVRCLVEDLGYPRGLTGNEIPLTLRIAGIADVFASLTCSRPFRDAASSFEALRVMRADMAGSFDRKLLDSFVRLLGD